MNTQIVARTMTDNQLIGWAEHQEWMRGFNAYAEGELYEESESVNWRKGWREAKLGEDTCHRLDAQAYVKQERKVHVLTDDECAAELADLHDWHEFMADMEWDKRGAW